MGYLHFVSRNILLGLLATLAPRVHATDADTDWQRRSTANGVIVAVGFDDIHDWAKYNWDRSSCAFSYQVLLDGHVVGCRTNSWDSKIRASGKGSVRFDIHSRSGQGSGGNIAIPFGDYATHQFGANSQFWVSWRQRMDARFLQGYRAQGHGYANFKQVIIAQGDMLSADGKRVIPANACSEAELVIVSSTPGNGPTYPIGYLECGRYLAFEQRPGPGTFSGDGRGSTVITRQNGRTNPKGQFNCIAHPVGMDQSGCFVYRPDEWMTFMVHVVIGPDGKAVSSVSGREQPGYINSAYELYAAHPGEDFQLLHRQAGVVIPKGQFYVGGDPLERGSYRNGWGPGDAHPEARYGKLWLLPYMTNKDSNEESETSSTWFDEVIVSRCKIAAPGQPTPKECNPPPVVSPVAVPESRNSAPTTQPPRSTPPSSSTGTSAASLPGNPSAGDVSAPMNSPPRSAEASMPGANMLIALRNLKPGHWLEIPHSEMVRVQANACKLPPIQRAYDRIGNGIIGCNPDMIMAWSGGAYDTRKHRLLVWGGGHSAYAGNEIYAFEMVDGKWVRLTEPTPPLLEAFFDKETKKFSGVSPPWRDPDYPPAPISVHSYDQLEFLPDQNKFFAAGGSTFSGNGYATSLTWLFDLSRNDAAGWHQSAPMPGRAYGLFEYNMATAYDPVSKKVIMRGYSQAGTFDPATESWKITNGSLRSRQLGTVGEIDPKRRKFVILGGVGAEIYPVGDEGQLGVAQPLGATGDTAIEQCYGPGLAYDSKADRMVAWCGKGDVYSLDLDRRVWTRHAGRDEKIPGDPTNTPGTKGTWGRFRYMPEYNAYIVVNGNRQNVFIYRLADDKGTVAE